MRLVGSARRAIVPLGALGLGALLLSVAPPLVAAAAPAGPAVTASAAGAPASPSPPPPAGAAVPSRRAAAAPLPDARRENKALVRRYLTDLLAAGKLEGTEEIVGKSFVDRSPGAPNLHGAPLVRQLRSRLQALFTKVEYDPQEMTAEDDRVAARYLVLATPRAERGQPAPQPLVLNGIALFRVRDGRLQEVFVLNDQVGLLRQLGYSLVPPGGAPHPVPPADHGN